MSKVRVDHEDVFIQNIGSYEEIPERYHFDFNSNWVSNNSQTKKIAIRKIDVVPLTFTAGAIFSIKKSREVTRISKKIMFTLTGKKSITDYLDYLVKEVNDFLISYYSSLNAIISYGYNKSTIEFFSTISHAYEHKPRIVFFGDAIKNFNIKDDMKTANYLIPGQYIPMLDQNVQPGGIPKTVEIMIDADSALMGQALNNYLHTITFYNVWNRKRLFYIRILH
jgi:hypothetical protein